jgi:uncharacterized membrane protein SpoIIM required for sporulation
MEKLKKMLLALFIKLSVFSFISTILCVLISIWTHNNRVAIKFSSTGWLAGILTIIFVIGIIVFSADWDNNIFEE